jgi:microcystin-dependent protein
MNAIDFTQPNGFPLEAQTLEFMQSDYQRSICALAMGFGGGQGVIVQGLVDDGVNVSEGWIVWNTDLVYFQGGAKQATFNIVENWQPKANQNGVMVNRLQAKLAQFGTGTSAIPFASLVRVDSLQGFANRLFDMVAFEDAVILSGMVESNITATMVNIASGTAVVNRKFVTAPAYSGVFPVYLSESGVWATVQPTTPCLTFNPTTGQRLAMVYSRAINQIGTIAMRAALSSDFDGTGLGKGAQLGWALCNGGNGTFDFRGRTPFGYDPRTTGPNDNVWDIQNSVMGYNGGEKAHLLNINELPRHNHTNSTPPSTTSVTAVPVGQWGLVRRTVVGENKTATNSDALDSGIEPDLKSSPVDLLFQGNDSAHENRPPFTVVAFLQRI